MKQYDNYKDSGTQWLGNIPTYWKLLPLRHYISFTKGKIPSEMTENAEGYPYLTMDYLRGRSDKKTLYPKNTEELLLVDEGDIIVLWDGANAGEFLKAKKGYLGSTMAKIVFDENEYDMSYFFYLLCSLTDIAKEFANGTTIPHFDSKVLTDYSYPCPSFNEQLIIASYLNTKVGQIDAILFEKEEMIKDLQNYRKSIISETIKCGLNPNVPMKYSGVEWIGMIPEHWECAMLRYYLDQPLQYGANESAESENKEWPRYIRITDISDTGRLKDETFKSLAPEKAKDYMLEKGDILFARSGATVGKTYIFKEDYPACFAGYLIKARCNHKLLPEFLYYYTCTKEYDNWKNSTFIQATIQNIGADKYSTMPVVVPATIEEQSRIVEQIELKLTTIDSSISELQLQIDELVSYKSSLIYEAVTGKIDLR